MTPQFNCSPPAHIQQSHWDEWVIGSAIDPDLTALNLHSLSGTTPHDYLLYSDKLPRRNDGRLAQGILRQYRHLEAGGWWCSGLDPLTGEDSLWGCFKPNAPRSNTDGKPIKYEHPPKTETGIFALRVPLKLQPKISDRSGVVLSDAPFWSQVLANTDIPIVLTEGSKKAGAILGTGYAAIALPGIYNGYRIPKDAEGNKTGSPSLIPQLAAFATPGRKIIFAFDSDTKPKTIRNVNAAINTTAKLLEARGCQCYIASWTKQHKGADDLITAKGEAAWVEAIEQAKPLALWQVSQLKQLTYPVSQEIDPKLRYLPDLEIPPSAKLIALKARKGRGKTRQLARIVERAIAAGRPALILCHRRQLVEELCRRCGINTITEWRSSETGRLLGYGLCVDVRFV